MSCPRREGIAGQDDLQRPLCTDDARQALRAAGAGNDAQLDLGQGHLRRFICGAIVTRQRQFQAAAEGRRMQGRDDDLGEVFDPGAKFTQRRLRRRLTEFADVRPAGETAPATLDDHGFDAFVALRLFQCIHKARPHGMAQGVDGG